MNNPQDPSIVRGAEEIIRRSHDPRTPQDPSIVRGAKELLRRAKSDGVTATRKFRS
jgi:hypothetical protein